MKYNILELEFFDINSLFIFQSWKPNKSHLQGEPEILNAVDYGTVGSDFPAPL